VEWTVERCRGEQVEHVMLKNVKWFRNLEMAAFSRTLSF